MIVHVVLVRWKEWASRDQIAEAKGAFRSLTSQVPGISGAYWGSTIRGASDGFDVGVVVLAETPAALDAYRAHPDHAKLTSMIGVLSTQVVGANLEA